MNELTDRDESGLGWVYPPQPQQTFIEEVIGMISGVTELVEDQDYIDVTFGSAQPTADWVMIEASIFNTTDGTPINVWPGVVTSKTTGGFRLQLNGVPDSANYILNWSIRGVFGYYLSGPSSGVKGAASGPFTVRLPDESTMTGAVVITPGDGGAGGIFTPTTVSLTTDAPSAIFTYTPSTYTRRSIAVTNDRGMVNPPEISFQVYADVYTLSGPSTGSVGLASTNFTAAIPLGSAVAGSVTVTPSDGGGGGTFTPVTVALTTAAPSTTFTYTAVSAGAKTLSVTNDGGLSNPGNLTYTASTQDGDPVGTWPDSSVHANHATQTGSSRPIFKTNIVNGKPVVRFTSAGTSGLNLTSPISGDWPWCVFVVMKPVSIASLLLSLRGNSSENPAGPLANTDSNLYAVDRGGYNRVANAWSAAFHVFTADARAAADGISPVIHVDGTLQAVSAGASANSGDFITIGYSSTNYSDGDIAEIIIYNALIGATNRANIEKYLGTKYGISVAGGSAVQPDTVTGLSGWWKADSLA